jgi:hypothetical protein
MIEPAAPARIPIPMAIVLGLQLLVAAEWLLILTAALFDPARFQVSAILSAVMLFLSLGIAWGIWNRRGGAWFLIAFLQLLFIVTNSILLLAAHSAPSPALRILTLFWIAAAVATVAYFLTPQAKRWFRIDAPPTPKRS